MTALGATIRCVVKLWRAWRMGLSIGTVLQLTENSTEREFLIKRRHELSPGGPEGYKNL
jgi:hypothetical protein